MEKDEKGPKCRKSGEPVVHFGEWTTLKSRPLATWENAEKGRNAEKSESQWTTLKSRPLAN